MSWHFLQGQEAASWEGNSLEGAPSALLSLMPPLEACFSPASETGTCPHSRYGTTFAPSTVDRGAVRSTLCAQGSPAKTYQLSAQAPDWTASAAAYGATLPASFVKLDPSGSNWRTAQCSLLEDSETFCATWPAWGSMHDGECCELRPPAWTMRGTDAGSWPTPIASDEKGSVLPETAQRRAQQSSRGVRLPEELTRRGLLPGGRHNPEFSEWLMGWPERWTDTAPLETAKFHEWWRLHGEP